MSGGTSFVAVGRSAPTLQDPYAPRA